MGLEQNKNIFALLSAIAIFFLYFQDVTNSITEVPEVAVQVSEWQAALHLCVRRYVRAVRRYVLVWGHGCTRCILTQHWVNLIQSLTVVKVSVDVKQH